MPGPHLIAVVVALVMVLWPASERATALCVVSHESRLRIEYRPSPTGDRGVWQINEIHQGRIEGMGLTLNDMYDPIANTVVAYDIWREQGWAPWAAYWKYCTRKGVGSE